MDYRCYQTILRVKHFYTNRERCEVRSWRRLGEYVTLDGTFYSLLFKQKEVAAPSYFHIVFLTEFLEEDFVRNTIIVLCLVT